MVGKRFVAALAVAGLLLGACSSTKAAANTYAVNVDAKSDAFNLSTTAYFPNAVTAHPGDALDFTGVFRGEPHTVTFGTLVTDAVTQSEKNQNAQPESDKKLPNLLPNGPGDAVQAAAQPCFLATGDPPTSDACTKAQQTQPAFDGTQTYYNSGFVADGESFKLTLSDKIAPGTYRWMCLLHREGMTGTLTVVASDKPADTPDAVTKRGADQLSAIVGKLQPAVTAAQGATGPHVSAGIGDQSVQNAIASEFGPKTASVPVGGTVSWTVLGAHSIAFNAPANVTTVIGKAPDGSVHLTVAAVAPSNSPPAPGGPNGVSKPTPYNGGAWDGQGFHSTGIILSFPPGVITYSLKFTKAGTYTYKCLIHVDMEGTVKVG